MFCLGAKNWTPDKFWASTFYEISCAYIGHCKDQGKGRWRVHEDGWSTETIEAHRQEIEELKRRFPDGPKPRKKKVGRA